MALRQAALALFAGLFGGLAPATAGDFMPEPPKLGHFVAIAPPRPAPAFAFANLDGKPVGLSDFKGKPVIVNLWATWCGPCKKEMPSLDRLQSELGGRIAVLAISEDLGGAKIVKPFLAKLKLGSLTVYLDPGDAAGQAFGVRGLPTSIVIDKSGRAVGVVEGEAKWDSAEMHAALKPYLGDDGVIKASLR